MTKKEAQKTIKFLHTYFGAYSLVDDKFESLIRYIESLEEPKAESNEFRVKPEEGQVYYHIRIRTYNQGKDIHYNVENTPWNDDTVDNERWSTFNCFLSEEKAELACRKKNAWLKLRQLEEEWAKEHGWPYFFESEEKHRYGVGEIYCDHTTNKLELDVKQYSVPGRIGFRIPSKSYRWMDWHDWIKEQMGDMLDDLFLVVRGN